MKNTRIDDASVARLVAAGGSARTIAAQLGLTDNGVRKSAKRAGVYDRLMLNAARAAPSCRSRLSQARLKEMLNYDPATGLFTRLVGRTGPAVVGTVAGHLHTATGYIYIWLDGRSYLAHRLAWFYMYGEWPSSLIDHINRVRDDNRIANLRVANESLNAQNSVEPRAGKQVPIGVRRHRTRFTAFITVNYVCRYLGSFATAEAASDAYQAAKKELHPGAVLMAVP